MPHSHIKIYILVGVIVIFVLGVVVVFQSAGNEIPQVLRKDQRVQKKSNVRPGTTLITGKVLYNDTDQELQREQSQNSDIILISTERFHTLLAVAESENRNIESENSKNESSKIVEVKEPAKKPGLFQGKLPQKLLAQYIVASTTTTVDEKFFIETVPSDYVLCLAQEKRVEGDSVYIDGCGNIYPKDAQELVLEIEVEEDDIQIVNIWEQNVGDEHDGLPTDENIDAASNLPDPVEPQHIVYDYGVYGSEIDGFEFKFPLAYLAPEYEMCRFNKVSAGMYQYGTGIFISIIQNQNVSLEQYVDNAIRESFSQDDLVSIEDGVVGAEAAKIVTYERLSGAIGEIYFVIRGDIVYKLENDTSDTTCAYKESSESLEFEPSPFPLMISRFQFIDSVEVESSFD